MKAYINALNKKYLVEFKTNDEFINFCTKFNDNIQHIKVLKENETVKTPPIHKSEGWKELDKNLINKFSKEHNNENDSSKLGGDNSEFKYDSNKSLNKSKKCNKKCLDNKCKNKLNKDKEKINESKTVLNEGTGNFFLFDSPNLAFDDEEAEYVYEKLKSTEKFPEYASDLEYSRWHVFMVDSDLDKYLCFLAGCSGYYEGMNIGIIKSNDWREYFEENYEKIYNKDSEDGRWYKYGTHDIVANSDAEAEEIFNKLVEDEYKKAIQILKEIHNTYGGVFINVSARFSNGEVWYSTSDTIDESFRESSKNKNCKNKSKKLKEGIKDYLPRAGFIHSDENDKESSKVGGYFAQGTDDQLKKARIIAKVKLARGERFGRVTKEDLDNFDEYYQEYQDYYGDNTSREFFDFSSVYKDIGGGKAFDFNNVDYDQILKKYSEEYDRLYNDEYNGNDYYEALDYFDNMMKDCEDFKQFVRDIVKYRGDVFSSDRECVALMFALSSLGIIEKFNQMCGNKINENFSDGIKKVGKFAKNTAIGLALLNSILSGNVAYGDITPEQRKELEETIDYVEEDGTVHTKYGYIFSPDEWDMLLNGEDPYYDGPTHP